MGQPIGDPVDGWSAPSRPPREPIAGRYCRVEPLDPAAHGHDLHIANSEDLDARMWTYMPYGPFASEEAYREWVAGAAAENDPMFHAIVDVKSGRSAGVASYLRIDPEGGCIEVGHIAYSPRLQRTAAATEAMYLLMRRAFELGYRRYEWKCDALNAASRAAAERLGFTYEGTFRQARVYKGRNRDTAWYSIIDKEWPNLEQRFTRWLEPSNFDDQGRQRLSLREM